MVTSPPAIEDPAIPAGTDDPALAENPPEVSVEPVEQVEPLPAPPVPAEAVPQESAPPPSPVGLPLPAQPPIPAAAAMPVDEERRKEEERLAKLRQQDERNLRHAALHAEEHYKDFDFSDMPDRKAAMKTTTVESYISFHLGGRPLPGSRMERELLRVEVALQRFHGRGAESEEAFHQEISKEAQHQEDRESLGRELMGQATRSVLISRFQPEMAGRYGWQQFQETARKHPAYSLADEGKLFPMWVAVVKEMDGHITPFAPQMERVWEGMKRDAAAGVAASVYQEIAPKDRAAFMSALGMLARSLPKDEQATFFGNLRKQAGRDIGTLLGNIASMPASGDDLYGLGDFIGIGPTGAQLRREWAGTRDRLLAARNFEMDVKRIEHEIYNPVKSAFGEGAPGIVESGVYAIPGALASTVVAVIPYVGLPALYSSLEASSYDTVRRQLLDSGMQDEAATYHAAQWAPYVALPQVALERLQAGAILGKLPFLEKAFAKFGSRITSDVVRGTLRVGIGAVQETSIEMAQGYIPYLLQDAASALSEDIPGVVWRNGKDGVLDGFWAQSASTLVTMLPLAILGAAGGVNADQRVKAFSNASDTTLLALGGSPEAIAALREAQGGGHASANAAIDKLFATLQPNGESAKQAAARLDAEQRGNADASSGDPANPIDGSHPATGDAVVENPTPPIEAGMAREQAETPGSPAPTPAGAESQAAQPMVSEKVFETFSRSATDPTALVPDSEKIHRNIHILRPKAHGNGAPLDISSNDAAPFREGFDQRYRSTDGYLVRGKFIPGATEAEALAEYTRRHGKAAPSADLRRASAWVDGEGNATPFKDTQEQEGWRETQIRSAYIDAHRGEGGPTESSGLTYEESVKDHPFLEIMATIPHDTASYNIATGRFSFFSSQGGRTYELRGDINGKNIHIAGLFPKNGKATAAGPSSFGSDFMITVLAYSRQTPGITITANAARSDATNTNGYAMWPKLGFEAKNPIELLRIIGRRGIPESDAAKMKKLADTGDGIPSLLKLNSDKEGQLLWRKYGQSIDVYFDTSPESAGVHLLRQQTERPYKRALERRKKASSSPNPDLQSE